MLLWSEGIGAAEVDRFFSNSMNDDQKEEQNRRSGLAYSAGLVLFFSVATLAGLGLLLDKWLNFSPWFAVAGIVLGTVVGFYEFFRIISRIS